MSIRWSSRFVVFLAAVVSTASAQTLIDDFSSLTDAAWTQVDTVAAFAGGPSTFDASSGAYTITTASLPTQPGYVATGASWNLGAADLRFSNAIYTAKVRILNNATNALIFLRSFGTGTGAASAGYSFFLEQTTDLIGISRIDANPNGNYFSGVNLASAPMTLVPNVDYMMEARAVGGSLSLKVWPASQVAPGSPQVNIQNSAYPTRNFEIAIYNQPSTTPGNPSPLSAVFDDISFVYPKPVASKLTLPNGSILLSNSNLVPGREYWNVFSLELCAAGIGTGPYAGLCVTDVNFLINQVLMPVGAEPFHYIPIGGARAFGPYNLPSGTNFEFVVIDLYALDLDVVSNVSRVVVP